MITRKIGEAAFELLYPGKNIPEHLLFIDECFEKGMIRGATYQERTCPLEYVGLLARARLDPVWGQVMDDVRRKKTWDQVFVFLNFCCDAYDEGYRLASQEHGREVFEGPMFSLWGVWAEQSSLNVTFSGSHVEYPLADAAETIARRWFRAGFRARLYGTIESKEKTFAYIADLARDRSPQDIRSNRAQVVAYLFSASPIAEHARKNVVTSSQLEQWVDEAVALICERSVPGEGA